ncbi:MAG: DedA family protein [Lacisediminihabitans sp.]
MVPSSTLIPWLDPTTLIDSFGPYALLGVCFIVFAETGLLVGFVLPGDTLLFFTGLLTYTATLVQNPPRGININIWLVCLAIAAAAFLGGEVGYLIGHKAGPRVFERKESGFFSKKNVERTNAFFLRFGGLAVIVARFVPVVRTFAPVAAGVGHMKYSKYSLYNAIGAAIWGTSLTLLGYLLGQIPVVADFAVKYIDLVLIGIVLVTLVPTLFHYVQSTMKARKANREGAQPLTDEAVILPSDVFDHKHDTH